YGIALQNSSGSLSENINIINNTIAFNSAEGIWFFSSNVGDQILISQNSIFCNDVGGIQSQGAANFQNPGQILVATTSFIRGSGVNGETIEVFVNPSCNQDQGETYLGSATVSGGTWQLDQSSFLTGLALGDVVTMTSTDSQGNTSEFSPSEIVNDPFIVTNTNDAGVGSLRKAIENANAVPGKQSLTFSLPGAGPWSIRLASALPAISDPITIDARTQSGWDWNLGRTLQLNGQDLTSGEDGLDIQADNTDIYGLEVINFVGSTTSSGILVNANFARIEQNVLQGNSLAIQSGLNFNDITIRNNRCGTTADGLSLGIPNDFGVFIFGGSNHLFENNVLSGNLRDGMVIDHINNSIIRNNNIGVDAAGNSLPNGRRGINVNDGSSLPSTDVSIQNNVIAYNVDYGVWFLSVDAGDRIALSQNSIFCNEAGGLLFQGGNGGFNPPPITNAISTEIEGTGINGHTVEVFVDTLCN
ncbi:MAG: right-handed parallel beta-helix repeat-containing protein, partial [Bacteroidota bacterium]